MTEVTPCPNPMPKKCKLCAQHYVCVVCHPAQICVMCLHYDELKQEQYRDYYGNTRINRT